MNVRRGGVEIVNQSDFRFSGNVPQEDRYELIVIGAGIAGMVAAVTAAGLGKRVAVIEKDKVGGNCTNLTCIPSKTLIHLSHLHWEMAHLERLGSLYGSRIRIRHQSHFAAHTLHSSGSL